MCLAIYSFEQLRGCTHQDYLWLLKYDPRQDLSSMQNYKSDMQMVRIFAVAQFHFHFLSFDN